MILKVALLGMLLCCALAARADNEAAWNEAMLAVKAGREVEAQAAFVKLADATTNAVFKADALEQAALCAHRLKQVDAALQLAGRIPMTPRSKAVRLQLMARNAKWRELVEAFREEAFDRWPRSMQGEAFHARGQAYQQLKDGLRAEADLTRAVAALVQERDRAQACFALAETCRTLLKNDAKALAAYLKTQEYAGVHDRWSWTYYTATMTAAGMLSAQGRHAEAFATLDKVEIGPISGYWRSVMVGAYGAACAAQGRLVDAVARYGEASRVQGISDGEKAGLETKIAELLARLADTNTISADLVLAVKGRSDYQVVLPDRLPDADITAALTNVAQLIREAFAANGADIPVTTESARDPKKRGIYLGNTAFARAQAVDVAALPEWGYRHKAAGRDLILAGHDRPCPVKPPGGKWGSRTQGRPELGTVKAVTDFLRLYAGTRFLYPGAMGTEFLPAPVIAVPKGLDTTKAAAVQFNYSYWQTEDPFYIANNYIFPFNLGHHNWEGVIPAARYRETHPEYFALINGQRCCLTKDWTGTWAEQYCLSNPEVQDLIYKGLLATADLGFEQVSVNHPDGFAPCQCYDCRALYGTGDDWGEKVWIFYRKMAERLAKDRPGRRVEFYAYGPTANPPKTFQAFPDNTSLMLCTTTPESFAQWNRCRVPGGFSTYLYNWGTYHRNAVAPKRTPSYVEGQVRRFFDNHVYGVSIDGFGEAFGLEGPTYYAYGRLWDDPVRNRGADLLDEFCTGAFAEGAVPMQRFYDELHHALAAGELAAQPVAADGRSRPAIDDAIHYYSVVYTPARLAAMETQLQRAEMLATPAKARCRLALARLEFDYLKSNLTVIRFYEAYLMRPDLASRDGLLRALDTRNALLDSYCGVDKAGKPTGLKPIPGWPEIRLFGWVQRDTLQNTYETRRYKESVFSWDTAAVRAAPLQAAKRLTVRPVAGPVTLDARAWVAASLDGFSPAPGNAAALPPRTSVQALYSASHLYLRFEGEWPDSAVVVNPVPRDGDVGRQEALDVSLAPFADRAKRFHLVVNPAAGSLYDAAAGFIADPVHPLFGKDDPSWNGDWGYTTRLEPERKRWLALLALPFATLGAEAPLPGTVWRGNFGRVHHAGTNQVGRTVWSSSPALRDFTDPDAFGDLVFEK